MSEIRTKLGKQGDSTGVVIPEEALEAVGLKHGDDVTFVTDRRTGTITIRKTGDAHSRGMAVGRAFAARYRRTMAALAE